jgi:hypothetical protein
MADLERLQATAIRLRTADVAQLEEAARQIEWAVGEIERLSGAGVTGSGGDVSNPRLEAAIVRRFVQRVNARVEADILAGGFITGAHSRAIEIELVHLLEWKG